MIFYLRKILAPAATPESTGGQLVTGIASQPQRASQPSLEQGVRVTESANYGTLDLSRKHMLHQYNFNFGSFSWRNNFWCVLVLFALSGPA